MAGLKYQQLKHYIILFNDSNNVSDVKNFSFLYMLISSFTYQEYITE